MPNVIKIKSPDLDKLLKYLKSHPKVMLRHSMVAMKKSIFVLESSSKQNAPSNESTLRDGIRSVFTEISGRVIASAKHSIFVHEGTRPHWPPSQPNSGLDRWAKAKGIPTFLVARAIARHGTKAQPFMDDSIKENQTNVDRFFSEALDGTVNEIATKG